MHSLWLTMRTLLNAEWFFFSESLKRNLQRNLVISMLCTAASFSSIGMEQTIYAPSIQSYEIPQEIYADIFYLLSGLDRVSAMLTCKDWLLCFDLTAMKLFVAYFGHAEKDARQSWMSLLKERLRKQTLENFSHLHLNQELPPTREGKFFINAVAKWKDLKTKNLSSGYFFSVDFTRAQFNSTKAKKAIFKKSKLLEAYLTSAKLKKSRFSYVILTMADLSNADLSHAVLSDTVLTKTTLTAADLTNATFDHAYHHDDFERKPVTLEWLQKKGAVWDVAKPPMVIND